MTDAPFVLVDRVRAEQFMLLGRTRRLLHDFDLHVDRDGIAWAIKPIGSHLLAYTWLGQGWIFDPFASRTWANKRSACLQAMKQADTETHQHRLDQLLHQLRLGAHSERILWFIHRQVIQARTSVFQPADADLAVAVWGYDRNNWPRQWRQDLADILQGLAWLHVSQPLPNGTPYLGMNTALLTHAADLRGRSSDQCAGFCSGQVPGKHHHYVINVGRGFLGVLEQFGSENEATGIRSYYFPVRGPRDAGPTLQRVGKTGRLVSVYLPARLGEPAACGRLTVSQHRLSQALLRETTRSPRCRSKSTTEVDSIIGNLIPNTLGTRKIPCAFLNADRQYVGFNGNGRRSGLGYYLTTPGGWLSKTGYALAELSEFLADLGVLQDVLGLIVVGIEKTTNRCYDLEELQAMAGAAALRAILQRVLVRVYTSADYLERWNHFFDGESLALAPGRKVQEDFLALVAEMHRRGISRRALAHGVGVDPSFLSKLFNGKKTWLFQIPWSVTTVGVVLKNRLVERAC